MKFLSFIRNLFPSLVDLFYGSGARSEERYSGSTPEIDDDDDSEGMRMIQNNLDSY